MANVTGVVEVYMTNRFDSAKVAMKLEGNDTWYSQRKEWMEVEPKKGDTVEFSPGKGQGGAPGKYIQFLKILESASGNSSPQQQQTYDSGSPNPAAVGQVLNILLDSGQTLQGINAMSDVELTALIADTRAAKDRISKLWDGAPKPKPTQAENTVDDFDDDEIPF